ncbi:hypothetical protein H2241_23425 [Pantoea ananatis]|uniref:hypothetical protein n=1 Tax=Pantoea ananas TaxID=553 RepID=UPI00158B46DC|nr:hypothetical protein [Pantoea ananatis]MBA4823863.1 hypothetical protein [Pantoea ananatis]QKV86017.1 hypothetical protein FOB88_02170 [Pantoea ananatis]
MPEGIIAVCASGPSLCCDDIYRLRDHKIPVITVNSSWMIYPECQYIFAGDDVWWANNYHLVHSQAQRWTCSKKAAQKYGINYFERAIEGSFNSGMMAILLAISLGAVDIILLGFDCSLEKGLHWHGKHSGLNNPTGHSIRRWKTEFEILTSKKYQGVNIVNCTPETRLTCFQCATLETRLQRIKILSQTCRQ